MNFPSSSSDADDNTHDDLIGSASSVQEIVDTLARHGCLNLTSSVDLAACSHLPLSGGGFCDVYRGALYDGSKIAIKCLRLYDRPEAEGDSDKRKILKRAARESYYWSKLHHPNVLPLMGLAVFRGHISMVSEWMDNGTLVSYLRLNPGQDRIKLCLDICAGLCYIHENDMVHGDLKAANVMVSPNGTALIADFGNAQLKDLTLKFTNTTKGGLSVRWAAPELLLEDKGPRAGKEADVYACGMTLLETLTGKVPYEASSETRVIVLVVYEKKVPPRPENSIHDDLWNLLTSCWVHDPFERPSMMTVKDRLQTLFVPVFSPPTPSASPAPTFAEPAPGPGQQPAIVAPMPTGSTLLVAETGPCGSEGSFYKHENLAIVFAEKASAVNPYLACRNDAAVVTRAENDTPEMFLARLLESVSKTEVANAITSKNDAFHAVALGLYMERFNFVFDPLDIALRRLLMDLSLPKETQQIDRVMEAFAKRYADCNPGLFVSEDQAYVLAFSLMMLHTNAFNKSNKNKMTKADYVNNTRMPGVPPEILDCFFDNIVFAPFIFIEGPTNVNSQRGFVHESAKGSISDPMSNPNNSRTLLTSKPKIDPYYIITRNLLGPLRVPVDQYILAASPLSFTGTADRLDAVQLRRVFVSNTQLEIAGTGSECVRIGVNKLGLLSRKDDLLESGRRAVSRKWRRWAVVLTVSQLLFFREAAWPLLELNGADSPEAGSQTSTLKPEEVVSLKDAIALYDVSYAKYTNVFRFVMPTGRQQLMQAANEQDMNEWIARINYASALKSAGVRVRELVMNAEESRATGVAAAVSHVRDQRRGKPSTPPSWSHEDLPSGVRSASSKVSENLSNMSSEVELDVAMEPSDGGMKDTFDEIKAQLAASHNTFPRTGLAPPRQNGYRAMSLGAAGQRPSPSSSGIGEDGMRTRATTRAGVVASKVQDLESKINTTQSHLQNELRIARNFAVLAPFQQATRTRIRLATEGLARRVQVVRMDLAKMACHRDVLVADLAAEEEEKEQLRAIALEAAREQLLLTVPRMTLSVHDDVVEEEPERRPSPAGSDASASPAWSFRSATDYPDDPTLVPNKRDTSLTTPDTEAEQLPLSPPRKSEASLQPRPSFAASVSSRSGMSHVSSNDANGHSAEQGNTSGTAVTEEETEEQAEVWHATRAGRRVSLVELPHPPEGRKLAELIRQRTHSSRAMGEGTSGELVS